MTNKHDGPRPGTPVTVIQAATPTRLTQAEAAELDTLIDTALQAKFMWGSAMSLHGIRSQECAAAEKVYDEAFGALYRWQRTHGPGSK